MNDFYCPLEHTKVFKQIESVQSNYRDMLVALWPLLSWRHFGAGALQAYIREGEQRELRVHLWHPELVKPGITESGLCHDHRFDMRSNVIVGAIRQTEFFIESAPDGDWETYTVLHARAAMEKGGSFHQGPVKTGERFHREDETVIVRAGYGYFFEKFAFHETEALGLTITLVEKLGQEPIDARILAPYNVPIVHAFSNTKDPSECKVILALGLKALEEGTP